MIFFMQLFITVQNGIPQRGGGFENYPHVKQIIRHNVANFIKLKLILVANLSYRLTFYLSTSIEQFNCCSCISPVSNPVPGWAANRLDPPFDHCRLQSQPTRGWSTAPSICRNNSSKVVHCVVTLRLEFIANVFVSEVVNKLQNIVLLNQVHVSYKQGKYAYFATVVERRREEYIKLLRLIVFSTVTLGIPSRVGVTTLSKAQRGQ